MPLPTASASIAPFFRAASLTFSACFASLSASMSKLSLISLSLEMAASLTVFTSDFTLSPTASAASFAADLASLTVDLASLPADATTFLASELVDDAASLMLSRTSAAAELTAFPAPARGLESASDASGEMSEAATTAAAAATPIRRATAMGFSAAMVGGRVETADRRVAGAAKAGVHGTKAMVLVREGGEENVKEDKGEEEWWRTRMGGAVAMVCDGRMCSCRRTYEVQVWTQPYKLLLAIRLTACQRAGGAGRLSARDHQAAPLPRGPGGAQAQRLQMHARCIRSCIVTQNTSGKVLRGGQGGSLRHEDKGPTITRNKATLAGVGDPVQCTVRLVTFLL